MQASAISPPLTKLKQELIGRHEERILLKDTANDDQRVCPHDVNHCVTAKLSQMVSADDRVVVAPPDIVYTRLEFNHVVNVGSTFNHPVHTAANAAEGKSSRGVSTGQPLKDLQHPIGVEAAVWKVDFGVDPKLQLPALLCCHGVDARGSQA